MCFEQRSIGAEALRKLFEQLMDLLEELGAVPACTGRPRSAAGAGFCRCKSGELSFCYLPGKQGHTGCFQKQIRELMEYLLPKLDHQEQDAVVLGYGLYREISAEIFSVEMIQALLYQTGKEKKETTEQEGKERPRGRKIRLYRWRKHFGKNKKRNRRKIFCGSGGRKG